MKYNGIDVSALNGEIRILENSNIDFAFVRSTYSLNGIDPRFFENVEKFNHFNIPIGAYHCLYSSNHDDLIHEVEFFVSKISNVNLQYPAALNIESLNVSNNQIYYSINKCLDYLIEFNYYPILFIPIEFINKFDLKKINDVDIWLKCFECENIDIKNLSIIQHSNNGEIEGIGSNINMDISFKKYDEIIKNLNMNQYKKQNISGGHFFMQNMTSEKLIENNQNSMTPIYNGDVTKQESNSKMKSVIYTVKPGDTLWGIAQTYLGTGQKYCDIQSLNHLENDTIHSGQTLLIPQNIAAGWILYNVESGDTLWNLARKYLGSWTKYNDIMRLNDLPNETIYPGQILKLPIKGQSNIYTVQPGDNLWSISLKLLGDGNRYCEIASMNNLGNIPVEEGQQLRIPEK